MTLAVLIVIAEAKLESTMKKFLLLLVVHRVMFEYYLKDDPY
jgi:hypothetical protein